MAPQAGAFPPIRPAHSSEKAAVWAILTARDLLYKTLRFDDFWVADHTGTPGAVLRLEESASFRFLSALGTMPSLEGQGQASALIRHVQALSVKPIYLYTIIPAFFARFGFTPAPPPAEIPSRALFDCERCEPQNCACMVYQPFGGPKP